MTTGEHGIEVNGCRYIGAEPEKPVIIGRERFLINSVSDGLHRLFGGPPPSGKTIQLLRRHVADKGWETRRGKSFDLVIHVDGEPTGHIARVTVELERFDPELAKRS